MRGIRPEVKLEWRTYHEETKKMISFHNQQLKTILNDETSDITLITEYTATEKTERRLTVECRAVGLNSQHFTLNTHVDLLFSSMGKLILIDLITKCGYYLHFKFKS